MEENLWKISQNAITPPNKILEIQAKNLTVASNKIIIGNIKNQKPSYISNRMLEIVSPIMKKPELLESIFYATAPKINYSLALMKITFSIIEFYPLVLNDYINEHEILINNESQLYECLREIIPGEKMTKLINNLIVQSNLEDFK